MTQPVFHIHALLGAQPDEGHQGVNHPHHPDVGHLPTNDVRAEEQFARMNTYENAAVELCYAESATVENDKMYRNMELLRHSALMPSRCPEDSMGGDIVEGPVVFLAGPLHVVQKQERGPGKLAHEGSFGSEPS